MAFLRKKGRVGGAANMDFANVCGPDESPGGGKQAHKEDGFQVSMFNDVYLLDLIHTHAMSLLLLNILYKRYQYMQ